MRGGIVMGSKPGLLARLRCLLTDHEWNYSIMYKHPRVTPHVVHEKACERCNKSVPRFLGPKVQQLEDAGITVRTRKESYESEGLI